MPPPDDDWSPPPGGPTLDEHGRVDGTRPAKDGAPTAGPETRPPASSFLADEAPLELEHDPQKLIEQREAREREEAASTAGASAPVLPVRRGGSASGALVALSIVTVAVLAFVTLVLFVPGVRRAVNQHLPHSQTPMLQIDSEPSGATVRIEGQEVGITPLFLDNRYGDADIRVELALPGYERWRGTFRGGQEQSVHAKLKRSGPGKRR